MKNSRLKAMFTLSNKVTVYIPATTEADKPIDNTEYVNRAATLLSECFGGATSSAAVGYWVSNTKGLIKESTTMVFAYASEEDLRDKLDSVIDFCETIKKELSQESIALEVNNEMYFI